MSFNIRSISYQVKSKLQPSIQEHVSTYHIVYASNVEEAVNKYYVRYDSYGLIETSSTYVVRYDSLYGDVVSTYKIRYHSGREITDIIDRYSLKYTSINPTEYLNIYSILYSTTSPASLSYRSIYRFRYTSEGVDETVKTYNMKYGIEYFKDRTQKYYIRYSTDTPYMFDTKSVLLRNNDETAVLFYLKGRGEVIDDMLFVFSNLPKYQLVEFSTETSRPHISILNTDDVKDYNLFGEEFETPSETYTPACYILVHGVDEVQNLSLDVYDKITLQKRNINKSFFFNLNSTEFYTNPVSLDGVNFEVVNYSSNYYNYEYLNFVEKSVTPLFKVYDSCCFNTKITDTSSNACSPF